MAGLLETLISDYQTELDRHRNRPFLRATMAACALVAAADGEVTFGERIRVDQVLDTLEALKVFDPHEGVDLFNSFTDSILGSPRHGREEAMKAVRAVAGDPERADLLIRICLAVGEAEGERTLVSEIEIVMLCGLLGVDPEHRGLYVDRKPKKSCAESQ